MRHQAKARFFSNVFKVAVAVVFEEDIPLIDGGNEEVFVTRIVDIGKGGTDADAIFQADASLSGNILELSVAQISPKFVSADLVHEVDVVQSVPVNVCHGETRAVIVVDLHVLLGGVGHDSMNEANTAVLQVIFKMESTKDLELFGCLELQLLSFRQSLQALVISGKGDFRQSIVLVLALFGAAGGGGPLGERGAETY